MLNFFYKIRFVSLVFKGKAYIIFSRLLFKVYAYTSAGINLAKSLF